MDAQVLMQDVEIVRSFKGKPIPEGSSLGAEYVKALYADAAAKQRPMPKPTPETLAMWGGELFVFPNLMMLPQGGNCMIYRVRPDGSDPESAFSRSCPRRLIRRPRRCRARSFSRSRTTTILSKCC